jgi:integrase
VYQKHSGYYYVALDNKWHRLGGVWDRDAKQRWAQLSSATEDKDTVAALLNHHNKHLATLLSLGKLSPRHYEDRLKDAEMLKRFFGTMHKAAVKRQHVAEYLEQRTDKHGNHAPVRANREIALLASAYRRDVSLDFNPCDGVPRNPENERTRYVTHWERRTFAKRCCPEWLRAYLLLKYLTGLRMADMLRLSHSSAGSSGLLVPIGKSRERKVLEFRWTRALRIATAVYLLLPATHWWGRDHSQNVTTTRPPARLPRTSGFKSAWRRAMTKWKAMGHEPFREHDIRAKTASDDPDYAQTRLAHSSKNTTDKHYLRGPAKVKRVRPLK